MPLTPPPGQGPQPEPYPIVSADTESGNPHVDKWADLPAKLTWNYRVILADTGRYEIREVYYDNDTGKVWGWTAHPQVLAGEDEDDVRKDYQLIGEAFDRPVLVEENLPGYRRGG